jgi:uncharacterized protein (DUF433 family)
MNKKKPSLNNILVRDPRIRNNKPRFKNTVITVEFILNQFASGWNINEIKALVPEVKKNHIKRVLNYFSKDINSKFDDKNNTREYSLG